MTLQKHGVHEAIYGGTCSTLINIMVQTTIIMVKVSWDTEGSLLCHTQPHCPYVP